MAESKGGYLINFEHSRREVLQESASVHGRFSFDLSTSDWKPEERNFFLIFLSGDRNPEAAAIAIGRRRAHYWWPQLAIRERPNSVALSLAAELGSA